MLFQAIMIGFKLERADTNAYREQLLKIRFLRERKIKTNVYK